jgi:hypothetical protein
MLRRAASLTSPLGRSHDRPDGLCDQPSGMLFYAPVVQRPIQQRDFDVFLSHAHCDRALVESLDRWLTETAGLTVWYDARELAGGSALATDLQNAIQRCRGVIVVGTTEGLDRGWVKAEYNAAMDERSNDPAFRVIVLRVGDANMQNLMRGLTWIDVPARGLDADIGLAIIKALYPGEKRPNPATSKDVYISCSWHQDDSAGSLRVCRQLARQGFRLIGDARDQHGFGTGDRVQSIISSCGAFVSIIPYRKVEVAVQGAAPYKYFLREIELANTIGLPSLVISDPRVRSANGSAQEWLPLGTDDKECTGEIVSAVSGLWEDWVKPPRPHHVFCALNLDSEEARPSSPIRHLVERITGMPTIVGDEIHEQPLNSAIMRYICSAFLVIADLTDDNVNVCIEAGMALAAGANVELVARGQPRRPPFMLRSLQMPTYTDGLGQIGVLHRVLRRYRRRIINAELL